MDPDKIYSDASQILDIIGETFSRDLTQDDNLEAARKSFTAFLILIESGMIRAASPSEDGHWQVDTRVKSAILQGFRISALREAATGPFHFCDKDLLWPSLIDLPHRGIRVVPGGTTIRRGSFLAPHVTVMPPSYINIGAYIDDDTMIDSHVLVGSCAQVGKRCHLSAAAQLGGVLEPIGALPVIVEDDCFIGGNCGIYEGTHLHPGTVLASGVTLTRSTPVFDTVNHTIIKPTDGVLHIPSRAVVIAGSRALPGDFAQAHGLSSYAAIIVKYRDTKTDASIALEEALR